MRKQICLLFSFAILHGISGEFWSEWSECSSKCGLGTRRKSCTGFQCPQSYKEEPCASGRSFVADVDENGEFTCEFHFQSAQLLNGRCYDYSCEGDFIDPELRRICAEVVRKVWPDGWQRISCLSDWIFEEALANMTSPLPNGMGYDTKVAQRFFRWQMVFLYGHDIFRKQENSWRYEWKTTYYYDEFTPFPLSLAVQYNRTLLARWMMDFFTSETGYGIDFNSDDLKTVLFVAAESRNMEAVKMLIEEYGMSPSTQSSSDFFIHDPTFLLCAAVLNHDKLMVRYLMDRGASLETAVVNPVTNYTIRSSVLNRMIGRISLDMAKFLIALGANPNAMNIYDTGHTVLGRLLKAIFRYGEVVYSTEAQREMVRWLITDGGADVNMKWEGDLMSALNQMAYYGDYEMTKLLVENGATTHTNIEGISTLYIANVTYINAQIDANKKRLKDVVGIVKLIGTEQEWKKILLPVHW